jgi:UDP-N-acetylmuramoyl-tripeptide--D-alanyl-D-alanine ligase
MRQNVYNIGSVCVIEDCYNASPESMKAAFAVQKSIAANGGRMVALLGDMYELGNESGRLHEQVGSDYALAGGELLFTFGESAEGIATGAILHGMLPENVYRNADIKNASLSGEMLIHSLRAGDVLLVKASRGASAERVIAYLRENEDRLPV